MKLILSFLFSLVMFAAFALEGMAGPYKVKLVTDPATIAIGKSVLRITITEGGKPVTGAEVTTFTAMPGMNMGERVEMASAGSEPGTYNSPASFPMAGGYEITVTVDAAKGPGKVVLRTSTGATTGGSPAAFQPWMIFVLVAIVLAVWTLMRMRATGQRVNLSALTNRGVVVSLILLGAAIYASRWAVQNLRRPGAMDPLEAQVMEMNTPAPTGTLPVVLATAERKPFAESVTYSGQVVGYVEQSVVPRVTGTILSMSVYVGDKVKRGQVIARLDPSQIDPMVSEKSAGVRRAGAGVAVAQAEQREALTMVEQAQAEVSMATAEVTEAKAAISGAEAERTRADAEVRSAEAEVAAAEAERTSAQADANYQNAELERMRSLFAKGAISKDEWQRAQADATQANAAVSAATQAKARAEAMVRAAKSDLSGAASRIREAQARVQKAESNLNAKRAMVRAARSAAQTAGARIAQSQAEAAEAGAALQGASALKDYTEIRAEVDGVVTQRLISPGVVVNPGQAILTIAQVSPIRIQANVPQAVFADLEVGSPVRAMRKENDPNPVELTITSLSPAVDPTSRMGTVEAVYDNEDGRFAPGQFVRVEIVRTESRDALVIPTRAVESRRMSDETKSFVWVATPTKSGDFSVKRTEVTLLGTSGTEVAVKQGLSAGDKVIVSPQGLTATTRVTAVTAPGTGITILITEEGFVPDVIPLTEGKPTTVTFLRKVTETCATSVEFKDLGIKAELPLNTPVKVTIPAQTKGKRLKFACWMDMITGSAVVE